MLINRALHPIKVNQHSIMLRNSLHLVISLSVLVACGPSDNSIPSGSGSAGSGANNAPPNAGNPISETILEDSPPLLVDLAEDVTDVEGDRLTYAITSIEPIDADVVVDTTSGILTYSPAENFNGHVTIVYEVADEFRSSPNTVDVEVTAVNDAPTAPDIEVEIDEDGGIQLIDLLAFDVDGDEIALDAITRDPLHGTLTISSDLTSAEYTPDPDFFGADSFEYQISDADGENDTGEVSINVGNQNDAPVAYPAEKDIDEDSIGQTLDLANFVQHADTVNLVYSIDANGWNAVVNGSIVTFSPGSNFNGDAIFFYTVTEDAPAPETAGNSVTFHVAPTNDDPIANNSPMRLDEDTVSSINLAYLISDVDSDDLSISISADTSNGILVNIGAAIYEYTPNPDYEETDSFTYTVDDGDGGNAAGTVTISVDSVNDAPTASTGTDSGDEDTSVSTDLVALGSDVDLNDSLFISTVTNGADGTVTINGDQAIYTPNLDFNGTDSYTFTLEDEGGLTVTESITVTVDPINDDPTGNDADLIVLEDEPFMGDLENLSDINDVDGDTLVYTFPANSAGGGQVQQNGTGPIFQYTSLENYNSDVDGDDSFITSIDDQNGGVIYITVNIVVNAVNDAPIAQDGPMGLDEDTVSSIDLAALIYDVEGDDLSIGISANTSNGILVNSGGTIYEFTPEMDYYGTDSFTYTVDDGNGGSADGTVTITVNPINDDPTGNDADLIVLEDEPFIGNLGNLSDINDVDGDTLVYTFPANSAGDGLIQQQGTGPSFRYTSLENYNSDLDGDDSFIASVDDQNGGVISITVNIVVNAVNDAPIAENGPMVLDEDIVSSIDLADLISDVDGDNLSISISASTSNGILVNSSGTIYEFTPTLNYYGTDLFKYTVDDGNGLSAEGTVTILIDPVNDDPIANNSPMSLDEDTVSSINLADLIFDVDGDDLSISISADTSNGILVNIGAEIYEYTPNPDYEETDSFTYTVDDGNGGNAAGTVTILVDSVNDAPTASNGADSGDEDTSVSTDVVALGSDVDLNDSLFISTVTNGANGAVTINGDQAIYTPDLDFNGTDSYTFTLEDEGGLTVTESITVTVNPINDDPTGNDADLIVLEDEPFIGNLGDLSAIDDVDGDTLVYTFPANSAGGGLIDQQGTGPNFRYTSLENYNSDVDGDDSFITSIDDQNGGVIDITVNIVVNAVNDAPIASSGADSGDEDTSVSTDVVALGSDVDLNDTLFISTVTNGTDGTVTILGDQAIYTPNLDFNGTDSYTFTLEDEGGLTVTESITVTINPVNDAPTASSGTDSGDEDTSVSTDLVALGSDVDLNDSLFISTVTNGANGTVTINGDQAVYTPNLDFNGTDSYNFTLEDEGGLNVTESITVTVNPVNDAPTASSGTDSGDEDTSVSTDVVALGSDVDLNDTLFISAVTNGANGTVTINGDQAVYTPNLDFNGTDSYTFTLEDEGGLNVTESITVTVNPIDDEPVAMADSFEVLENTQDVPLDVLSNDTDGDNDILVVSSVDDSQVTNGSLILNAGLLIFTPDADYFGTAGSFTYTVSDGTYSDTATATIVVTEENAFADSLAYELNGVTTQPQGFYSQVTENGSAFLLNATGYNPILTNVNGQGDVLFSATVDAALPNASYALTNAVLSTAPNNNVMLAMNFDNGNIKISTCMSFDAAGSMLWSNSVQISSGAHSISAVAGLPNGGALLAVYSDSTDSTIMIVLGSNGAEADEIVYDLGSHIINAIVPYANDYYMALSDSGILMIEDDGHAVFHYGGAAGSSINIASARLTPDGILMSGSDQSGSSLGAYSSLYNPALVLNPVLWSNTLADPLGQLDIEHNDLALDTAGNFAAAGSIRNIAGGTVVPTLHRINPVGASVSLSSFAAFVDGRFEGLIPNQSAANVVGSYSSGANFNFFTMSFDAADTVVSSCSTFGSEANQNFVSTPGTDEVMNLLKTNGISNSSSGDVSISQNSAATVTLHNSIVDRESLCL
jgi:hypothetical protein